MAINTFLPTGGSWSNTENWSLGSIPSNNQDTIIFTASSGNCVLDINGTCSNINFKDYASTFSFRTNTLVVNGNVTYGASMSFTYSTTGLYSGFNFIIGSSSTIVTNGATIGVPVCFYNFGRNNTYTLSDNFITTENFGTGASGSGNTITINGFPIYTYSSFYSNAVGSPGAGSYINGNSKVYMKGIGSIMTTSTVRPNTGGATFSGIGIDLEIDNKATLVAAPSINNLYFNNCTLTINGTTSYSGLTYSYSISSGGNFTFSATSCTSSSILPIRLSNVSLTGVSYSINLASDLYVSEGINSFGLGLFNNKVYTYGSFSNLSNIAWGNSEVIFSGTDSFASSTLTCDLNYIKNNITINTPGTIILNNPLIQPTAVNFISGTIISYGFRLYLDYNPSIYSNMLIPDIEFKSSGGLTLSSQLNFTNLTIDDNVDVKFLGTYSWTTDNFYYINGTPPEGRLGCGLSPNLTYIITNTMVCYPTENYTFKRFGFRSLSPGTYSKLVMLGSSQNNISITGDDIDSSDGNMIRIFNYNAGTQSNNVLNWGDIKAAYMEKINISLT